MISGRIEHRLLVNYRADPEVVQRLLPAPFRPQVHGGYAVVGTCLIRLAGLRPAGVPKRIGLSTDNVAQRFAVEWDTDDGIGRGVYIARRDSDSVITALVGGRLFPGVHHRARFHVATSDAAVYIRVCSRDGRVDSEVEVEVEVGAAAALAESTLFSSTEEASAFFERGSIGWSPNRRGDALQGLELHTNGWRVEPVRVRSARSSFFDDRSVFPTGSIQLDCALLMRDLPVVWRRTPDIRRDDVGHVRDRGVHLGLSRGAR